MITTNKTIEQLVGEKPFYISYFKKDGTIREMPQAILHEIDLAKIKNPNINKTQIIVFDNDKEGYRTVNIDKIIEISRGEEFKLVDSKYNELIEEDKMYQKIDTEKDMENSTANIGFRKYISLFFCAPISILKRIADIVVICWIKNFITS